MRLILTTVAAVLVFSASADAGERRTAPEPGIYTNEEEVYFDLLAKRTAAPWISVTVDHTNDSIKVSGVDAFQKPIDETTVSNAWKFLPSPGIKDRLQLSLPNGKVTELRRARAVSCWVSIRKDKVKADGSEDWYFQSDVKLHDQGGRAIVGGGDSGAQAVMIRVRNVTWDTGSTNAPVVALYVHKPDKWEKAESYSWAAPDSARVGINLRWVQTGCTIGGLGKASKLDGNKFKAGEEAKTK